MRYVDPSRIEDVLPGEWVVQARDARLEILAAPNQTARQKVLKDRAKVWQDRDLKIQLKRVMDNKCWYCETKQRRSDNAIDHFRPKSVYWWLAFDYQNYRFACTFCNSRRNDYEFGTSGGKSNDFPLARESERAREPGDDLRVEEVLLLDPCEFDDPPILWFDETGMPALNPQHSDKEHLRVRVHRSTFLYHLDQAYLTTARRERFLEIIQLCLDGDREFETYKENDDREALARYSALVVRVYRAIERSAQHSAAAMCAVRGLRTKSITARKALDRL